MASDAQADTSDTPTPTPTLIPLADVGALLGVAYMTPFGWWKRTKSGDAPNPMPKPAEMRGRSPLWDPRALIAWYADWKTL